MEVYATLDQLKRALGLPVSETEQEVDERLSIALVIATCYVATYVGAELEDPLGTWDPEGELELVEGIPAAYVQGALVAAVRIMRGPDVPFGVAGGLGEAAVYIARGIPEADTVLAGHRVDFGIG